MAAVLPPKQPQFKVLATYARKIPNLLIFLIRIGLGGSTLLEAGIDSWVFLRALILSLANSLFRSRKGRVGRARLSVKYTILRAQQMFYLSNTTALTVTSLLWILVLQPALSATTSGFPTISASEMAAHTTTLYRAGVVEY